MIRITIFLLLTGFMSHGQDIQFHIKASPDKKYLVDQKAGLYLSMAPIHGDYLTHLQHRRLNNTRPTVKPKALTRSWYR
ncbi:MAG: hypothetical protein WKI04_09400 [Ferruginibacter sp.]